MNRRDTRLELHRHLVALGLSPQPVQWGQTAVWIGWRVGMTGGEVVLRRDGDDLVVADLESGASPGTDIVPGLVALLRRLSGAMPDVVQIRGMMLPSMARASLHKARARLATRLCALGATFQTIDGERWLVFPCAAFSRVP
ncbi:hypothetical protein ACPWR0_06105 [Pandoraea pneumonica]|uniref:hypothetical protein n=1 Tax=Pandoraea pneumonica TaxID=2508299 RepID=UPI003CE66FD4